MYANHVGEGSAHGRDSINVSRTSCFPNKRANQGQEVCLLAPRIFFRTQDIAGAQGGPVNADGFVFLNLSPTRVDPFTALVL